MSLYCNKLFTTHTHTHLTPTPYTHTSHPHLTHTHPHTHTHTPTHTHTHTHSLQPCSLFTDYPSARLSPPLAQRHAHLLHLLGMMLAFAVFHGDTLDLSLAKPVLKRVSSLIYCVFIFMVVVVKASALQVFSSKVLTDYSTMFNCLHCHVLWGLQSYNYVSGPN